MSSEAAEAADAEAGDPPICEFCGAVIDEAGQRCAALADGRCRQ